LRSAPSPDRKKLPKSACGIIFPNFSLDGYLTTRQINRSNSARHHSRARVRASAIFDGVLRVTWRSEQIVLFDNNRNSIGPDQYQLLSVKAAVSDEQKDDC
jgi:hypothetical protein